MLTSQDFEFEILPMFVEQFANAKDGIWHPQWISSGSTTTSGKSYSKLWKITEETSLKGRKNDQGLFIQGENSHYAISAASEQPFTFKHDRPIVVQYEVKKERPQECSGAYAKLIADSKYFDPHYFNDMTPFAILFGPDYCGSKNEILLQLTQRNSQTGRHETWKLRNQLRSSVDTVLSTLYTLIIHQDETFNILVNNVSVFEGSLQNDFDLISSDGTENMPEWWDDREYIRDPTAMPALGEDEATWDAPFIKNANYHGPWTGHGGDPPTSSLTRGQLLPIAGVGFEIWSVEAGIIFDNIIVTQDDQMLKSFTETTWAVKRGLEEIQLSKLLSSASTPLYMKHQIGRDSFDWIMAEEIQPSGSMDQLAASIRRAINTYQEDPETFKNDFALPMLLTSLLVVIMTVTLGEICQRLRSSAKSSKKVFSDDEEIEIPRDVQKSAAIETSIPKPSIFKRDRQFSSPLYHQLSMSAPPSPREING